jgi:hypothetical protein
MTGPSTKSLGANRARIPRTSLGGIFLVCRFSSLGCARRDRAGWRTC